MQKVAFNHASVPFEPVASRELQHNPYPWVEDQTGLGTLGTFFRATGVGQKYSPLTFGPPFPPPRPAQPVEQADLTI